MDEGQGEAFTGKRHDSSKSKNRQETMNHLHTYMHTCIHKGNIFFLGNQTRQTSKKWGKIQVFCGNQELKPPRHEESKGRRSRQGGEPRLSDRTLGA